MSELVVIGITGGVGAGKSTILKYLKDKYSAVVLEADSIGRMLMLPGGETYNEIIKAYGDGVKREDGSIDNLKLAEIVFNKGGDINSINEIVHPAVVRYMEKRIDKEMLEALVSKSPDLHIVVIEAAILFEGGAAYLCDDLWYVHVSEKERIKRLTESRGYSEEKCKNIMKNQMSAKEFKKKCNYTINNEGELSEVYSQIDDRITHLREERTYD